MARSHLSIAAGTTVAATPGAVFEMLGDLDRHRELTDGGLRILSLDGPAGRRTGGLVALRGPAGLTRHARTRVQGAEPHSRLWGSAETIEGARADLEWRLRPDGARTHVELRVEVRARRWVDRVLLRAGGGIWLRARLRAALDRLAIEARTTSSSGVRRSPV